VAMVEEEVHLLVGQHENEIVESLLRVVGVGLRLDLGLEVVLYFSVPQKGEVHHISNLSLLVRIHRHWESLAAWVEEVVQDWKQMERVLVLEVDCSIWRTSQHLEMEVVLQIWAEAVLLAGMVLLVELALGEVPLLQWIFELAEALAELLVHALREHFEGFLTVSSLLRQVGVVGVVPYSFGSRFHLPGVRLLGLLVVA
jgi:hypothetical protein